MVSLQAEADYTEADFYRDHPLSKLHELGNTYIGKLLLKIPIEKRPFEFSDEFKAIEIFKDFRIINGIPLVLSAWSIVSFEMIIGKTEYDKIQKKYVLKYPPESRFLAQWFLDRWNSPDIDHTALLKFRQALADQISKTAFEIKKIANGTITEARRLKREGNSDEKIIGEKRLEALKELKILPKAKKRPVVKFESRTSR